ncbi:MAG: head GIN domain-containing protein [Pelolinea sp.]|nr:head GIN domain-containing protein [Pelolinea sp.]
MKNRNKVLISLALLTLSALALSACDSPIQSRSDDVSDFNRISIETFGEFIIEQGDEESLTIEAPRDFLRYVETDVKNGTLVISTRRGFFGSSVGRAIFTITVKDLESITLSGAGAIKIYSLDTKSLSVELTGAGSVEIDELTADRLEVNLTSAGAIIIAGSVDKQEINLTGVGSYEGGDLQSEDAEIKLSGAGSAVVWAEEALDVEITGVGSVSYFGDPEVYQNISGLGSINSKGAHQ